MLALLKRLHKEESGQDLIEYALIAGLIAVAATIGIPALATKINTLWGTIAGQLPS